MNVRTTRKLFAFLIQVAIATCPVLLCCQAATAEGSPAEVFKSRYGRRIWQVKDTTIPSDDLKLAKEILNAAGSNKLPGELLTLMCDAVYDLASKSYEGHPIALSAMNRLWPGPCPHRRTTVGGNAWNCGCSDSGWQEAPDRKKPPPRSMSGP